MEKTSGARGDCHGFELARACSLIVCGTLFLSGCTRKIPEQKRGQGRGQPAPVAIASVVQTNVPLQLHTIGHVVPFSVVTVQSRVDGMLDSVNLKDGDLVRQGDLIFTIDPRPFQAALNQAKANIEKDSALAANADIELRRNADLLTNNIVSREVYDQSAATANSLHAAVAADRAAADNAALQLSYCYIRSPINGRAGTIQAYAGNVVKSQSTVLVSLTQTEPVFVDFSLPEQELPRVRDAMHSGKLAVAASPPDVAKAASGWLVALNNTVDTNTGTIMLRSQFPNAEESLWPGQFVDVDLTLSVATNAILVPAQAVQAGQQGQYLFVVKPDLTVETRPVETASQFGDAVIVTRGVAPGESVVIEGQVRLAPGVHVRVQNSSPAESVPPHSRAMGGSGDL